MRLRPLLACALLGACSSNSTTQSDSSAEASSAASGASSSAVASSSSSSSTGSSSSSGGGGANLGCSMDPSLSASEKQLLEMLADSWMEVPNTHFQDFCSSHEPVGAHATSGCASVVRAWGGAAWDGVHGKMILWGGGHGDYWGNEVYGFSPKTMQWELLVAGTPVASVDDLGEPMADGTPVSRHTYDGLAYLTAENRFFGFGGATAPSGFSSILTWQLDVDAKTWKRLDAKQTLPSDPNGYYWMGTAYDEAGHRVFMRNEAGVYVYDLATDQWTRLIDAGYPPLYPNWSLDNYRRGVLDPKRQIFFTLGGMTGDGKPDFFAWDIQAKMPVYDQWQTTGGDDIASGHAPGADHDPTADAIVAWSGGPARVLDLATKQWSTKSGSGAPAMPVAQGTYGRFRYLARYNVFLLVNEADQNVYFYKHTAGCGP